MATRQRGESPKKAHPGDVLLVVHEFAARSADEITLTKGDRIELIEKDDDFGDGWYLGRHLQTGNTGLFPEVYTLLAPKASNNDTVANQRFHSARISTASTASTGHQTSAGALAQSPTPASPTIFQPTSYHDPETQDDSPTPSTRNTHPASSVMNEMHHVINEHITDLNKPGRLEPPVGPRSEDRRPSTTGTESSYSRELTANEETDEERDTVDGNRLFEEDVRTWTPTKVASYLESVGVEKLHCDIFRDEEFTGEVLLAMEQSQVFMKEFDLGPIGRRMRTWQKIKALQDQVANQQTPTSPHTVSRSMRSARQGLGSPRFGQDMTRPSAATVRSIGQRRHSSTDQTLIGSMRNSSQPPPQGPRGKQASFDRDWTMGASPAPSFTNSQRPLSTAHISTVSADQTQIGQISTASSQHSFGTTKSEIDRGYVSGGDVETKRRRNLIKKKEGSAPTDHKRISSAGSDHRRTSRAFFWQKSRDEGAVIPLIETEAEVVRHRDGVRIVSEPGQGGDGSPTVTRLEYDNQESQDAAAPEVSHTENQRASAVVDSKDRFSTRRGFRAISDAVTGRERALVAHPEEKLLPTEEPMVQSPEDGAASPASLGIQDANKSEFSTPAGSLTPGSKRKQKQQTSAYTRGLEKKSPTEQRIGADYSGWMKKKSTNLMTMWKPRYFVLKGRRLSYYYSENDTEEKGLIDISNHRVLPAEKDFLTGLHATLTGASSSSTHSDALSTGSSAPTAGGTIGSLIVQVGGKELKDDSQMFIFKLVPPRTGLSKGVNFTKPSIHYFAVPSRTEGRLWMAALMKSTIDRDDSSKVVTTYQQKTISLEQARAQKQLPPFLRGVEEEPYGSQTGSGAQEDDDNSVGSPRVRGGPDGEVVTYGIDDGSSTVSKPITATDTSASIPNSGPSSVAGISVKDMASNLPTSTAPRTTVGMTYTEPELQLVQREGPADLPQIMTNLETNGISRPRSEALSSVHSIAPLSAVEEVNSPLEQIQEQTRSMSTSEMDSVLRKNSNPTSGTEESSQRVSTNIPEPHERKGLGLQLHSGISDEAESPLMDRMKSAGLW